MFQLPLLLTIFKDFLYLKKWYYIVYIFSLAGIPIKSIIIPKKFGKITQTIKQKKSIRNSEVYQQILIIISLVGIVYLTKVVRHHIIDILWPHYCNYTRDRILNIILTRYSVNYESVKTGLLQSKINDLPWILDENFNIVQNMAFELSLILISTAIYLFYINRQLFIIYFAFMVLLIGLCYFYIKKTYPYVFKTEQVFEDYFEAIDDFLNNLISIYTNNQEVYNIHKIYDITNSAMDSYNRIIRNNLISESIYLSLVLVMFSCLVYYGIYLFYKKKINLAVFTSLFVILFSLITHLEIVYKNSKRLAVNLGNMQTMNTFLDNLPPEDKYKMTRKDTLDSVDDLSIKFINVDFSFHFTSGTNKREKNKLVYKNFNLWIKPEEHIIITGHIGSGKSTFGKLLIGLYPLHSGKIIINGKNQNTIMLSSLREKIKYIPQSAILFSDTLYENITYSIKPPTKKPTSKEILSVLDELGMTMVRDKFETMMFHSVGKLGNNLSGGQRQIVWLLRCIFDKSKMVILDEPTNNLDPKSKKNVIRLIEKIKKKNKQLIIITHDKDFLTTYKHLFNRHLTFQSGKIIQDDIM